MKGRIAAAALACAVLVSGCASTVAGTGVRGTDGGSSVTTTDGGSNSSSAPDSASATARSSAGGSSSVRPMPPLSSAPDTSSGGSSSSTPAKPVTPSTSPSPDRPSTSTSSAPQTGSPGGSTSASGPAGEFDGAASVDASKYPGTVTDVGFRSPSDNITCGISGGIAVCQIDKFDYTPPPHDCGPSGWGFNFQLKGSGSAFLFCAGDVESGGPVLAYGQQIVVGAVRCVSRQDGVTCQNTGSGYGFRLARASYTFFGPDGAHTVGSSGAGALTVPGALVGDWGGHGRALTIGSSGAGVLTYRTYQWCGDDPTPPCDATKDNQIVPGGHIEFALTKPAGTQSATGRITKSNDPKTPVGTSVTAVVTGYNLTLSFWPDTPFCSPNTPSDKWNCGA